MNVVKKLSEELPFLKEIDYLKREIDKHRPFSKELENKVLKKLRLDWNYNTNAIEGNSFTYGETLALLVEGITAKGKPLKDAMDIKGHNEAIDFMLDIIHGDRNLNETDIINLHKLLLKSDYYNLAKTADGKPTRKLIKGGQYKTEPNHVVTSTGEIHYYATPLETPMKMKELIGWYNNIEKTNDFHPLVLASLFHHKFVAIHPFDDGNGRMTRILTNFILIKHSYPISVIKNENKLEYYSCLAQADENLVIPIIEFISNTIQHSLNIYLKAINGEDINEPDDLDKEIALFRKEIGVKTEYKKLRKDVSTLKLSFEYFSYLKSKLDKFSDLFFKHSEMIIGNDGYRISNDPNSNYLKVYEEFKNIIKDKLENSTSISYQYILENDIYKKSLKLPITLNIRLKNENYIISYNGKEIIKYYDEVFLNQEYIDLVKFILKDVMEEVKKLKR